MNILKQKKWLMVFSFFLSSVAVFLGFQNCSPTKFAQATLGSSTPAQVLSICRNPFNNAVIAEGSTIKAFEFSSVPYGDKCLPQVRTCTRGILSGTFTNEKCTTWYTGGFGSCDGACATGTQIRAVECKNNLGQIVSKNLCTYAMPNLSQNCSTGLTCSVPSWSPPVYGSCSPSCGPGTQTPTVKCLNPSGATVSDSLCPLASRPSTTPQFCSNGGCQTWSWQSFGYGPCSRTCGLGSQSPIYICKDDITGQQAASESFCTEPKPVGAQIACNIDTAGNCGGPPTQPIPIKIDYYDFVENDTYSKYENMDIDRFDSLNVGFVSPPQIRKYYNIGDTFSCVNSVQASLHSVYSSGNLVGAGDLVEMRFLKAQIQVNYDEFSDSNCTTLISSGAFSESILTSSSGQIPTQFTNQTISETRNEIVTLNFENILCVPKSYISFTNKNVNSVKLQLNAGNPMFNLRCYYQPTVLCTPNQNQICHDR